MARGQASVVGTVVGVSAGLAASLPSFVCAGGACSSCFACLGAGGAAASALVVGFVSRRLGVVSPHDRPGRPKDAPAKGSSSRGTKIARAVLRDAEGSRA